MKFLKENYRTGVIKESQGAEEGSEVLWMLNERVCVDARFDGKMYIL